MPDQPLAWTLGTFHAAAPVGSAAPRPVRTGMLAGPFAITSEVNGSHDAVLTLVHRETGLAVYSFAYRVEPDPLRAALTVAQEIADLDRSGTPGEIGRRNSAAVKAALTAAGQDWEEVTGA